MNAGLPAQLRQRRPVVWVLAGLAGLALSLAVYRQLFVDHPALWTHSDEWIYRAAGELVRRHPASLYHARLGAPGESKLPFVYPPFAALLFALGAPFSFAVWQAALFVVNLLLLLIVSYFSARIAGRRGLPAAAAALLITAIAVWLEPVFMTLYFGQINLVALALIIADLSLPDSSRWKGIGIGIAAGLKLTPLIFSAYLLVSRRVRAGLVSVLSFLATIGIGFLLLPTASREYWAGLYDNPPKTLADDPARMQNQSINGVLQRLLLGHSLSHALWVVLAAAALVVGLAAAAVASRRGRELLGIVLAAATGLLVSPVSWTHHWVEFVVPGLVLVLCGSRRGADLADQHRIRGRDRLLRVAGAVAFLALFVMWPDLKGWAHGHFFGLPVGVLRLAPDLGNEVYHWHGATLLLGNAYVAAGCVVVVGCAVYLLATRRAAPGSPRAGPAEPESPATVLQTASPPGAEPVRDAPASERRPGQSR